MDGFDVGDYLIKGWTSIDTNSPFPGTFTSVAGRVGGSAINISTASNGSSGQEMYIRKFLPLSTQMTLGVAVQPTAYTNNGGFMITLAGDAGATTHLTLLSNTTTQALELRRGDTSGVLLASSASTVPVGVWAYIEIQATIADAGGTCIVRLNGSPTPIINFTGDTKNGGTLVGVDAITMGARRVTTSGGVHAATFDDLYVADGTGAVNNTFLGDVRAITLRPDGVGTDTQLTPVGSAINWQNVDENPYSTTDYNGSATVGQRDTYTLSDLPGGVATVYGLQTNAIISKDDVTNAKVRFPIRTGGSLYYGTTTSPSTSYLTFSDIHQVNPATTTSWTVGDINALEAGLELV